MLFRSDYQCDRYGNQQACNYQNERSPDAAPAPEEECSSDEADNGEGHAKTRRHATGCGVAAGATEEERGCNDEVKPYKEPTDKEEDTCHRTLMGL